MALKYETYQKQYPAVCLLAWGLEMGLFPLIITSSWQTHRESFLYLVLYGCKTWYFVL